MSVTTWLSTRLGRRGRESALATQVAELQASLAELQTARPAQMRQIELEGWRRLSESRRDLPAMTHARMIEIAVYLWSRNPLGRRIIEAQIEWMIGEGVTVSVEDPRADELVKRWWSLNRLDLNLMPMVRELSLFGEDCAPVFANPYSGVLTMGVLDPAAIQEVVPSPDNATVAIGVIQKAALGQPERRWRTLLRREDEEALSPWALAERERFEDGEVLFSAINKLRTATRGVSDLFALADWLDGYEQMLFAELNRTRALANFFWDIKLEGYNQEQIDDYLAAMPAPRPFSVFGHNEKVERKLVGPEEDTAANASEGARLFRNHVLGGAGQPEHWYGGGGDVNRSTSESMDGFAVKSLTGKQRSLRYLIRDRAEAQVEMGIRVGALRDTPEARAITVEMPDLSTKDVSRIASGVQSIASGLAVMKQEGWVDDQTAVRFVQALGAHVGVEIDPDQVLERAREQRQSSLADEAGRGYDRRLQRSAAEPAR